MATTVIHYMNDNQVLTLLDNQSAIESDKQHMEVAQNESENNYSKKIPKLGPFLLLKTLGIGEFGKVKLGRHAETGQIVAVKLVKKQNIDSSSRLEKVRMEIEIMKTLNHPFIVKLLCVNETNTNIGMVLEYAQGGELFEYIYKQRHLQENEARRLFSQLISCVHYMHQKNIVHRDLKLENILLDRHGNIIVTDFGFANQFTPKTGDLMSTACGSPVYAAPELVMTGRLYAGTGVDIWSCGIILFAMLSGYLPFDDDIKNPNGDNIGRLYRYIMTHQPKFPDHISPDAKDLISHMLMPEPNQRCKIDFILSHPWLAEYKDSMSTSMDDLEREAQLRKKSLLKGIESTTDLNIILDDKYKQSLSSSHHHSSSSSNSSSNSSHSSHSTTSHSDASSYQSKKEEKVDEDSDQHSDKAIVNAPTSSPATPIPVNKPTMSSSEPTDDKPSMSSSEPIDTKRHTIDTAVLQETPLRRQNLSLKAKFLASVKRQSNRHSWTLNKSQSVKERPSITPLVEASKSERLLSWIKKSKKPSSKRETVTLESIDELNMTIPIAKPIQEEPEIRVHTGNMNHSSLTSKDPMQVLLEINKVLLILGIDVTNIGGYKLKCVRRSLHQPVAPSNNAMDHLSTTCHSNTASQPIYGHPSLDNGDEIVFSVEICRFENLTGLFSVDIQCLSQNKEGYQFIGQKLASLLHYGDIIRNTNFNL